MSSPGLPRSGSRCQRRARPHIGDVAPPPEPPAGPSPHQRQNGVADKGADPTPPQPASQPASQPRKHQGRIRGRRSADAYHAIEGRDKREPRGKPGDGARRIGWHQKRPYSRRRSRARSGQSPSARVVPLGGRAPIMTLWPVLDDHPHSRSLLPMDRSTAGGSWSASTGRRDR